MRVRVIHFDLLFEVLIDLYEQAVCRNCIWLRLINWGLTSAQNSSKLKGDLIAPRLTSEEFFVAGCWKPKLKKETDSINQKNQRSEQET